ncbi:MAG: hypothetical protein HW420_883, partial [Candidatus Nitrosotenuis sp.]|nr:hypothetical protein [Candidatus Nitrosotenuis sp.]
YSIFDSSSVSKSFIPLGRLNSKQTVELMHLDVAAFYLLIIEAVKHSVVI